MVKRVWALIPALLLDPFDLYERLFGVNWNPPLWLMWTIFGVGLFVAAWLTYREIWVDPAADRQAIVAGLETFYVRAGQLSEENWTPSYDAWEQEAMDLRDEAIEWVGGHMSQRARSLVEHIPVRAKSPSDIWLKWLIEFRSNVEILMNTDTYD